LTLTVVKKIDLSILLLTALSTPLARPWLMPVLFPFALSTFFRYQHRCRSVALHFSVQDPRALRFTGSVRQHPRIVRSPFDHAFFRFRSLATAFSPVPGKSRGSCAGHGSVSDLCRSLLAFFFRDFLHWRPGPLIIGFPSKIWDSRDLLTTKDTREWLRTRYGMLLWFPLFCLPITRHIARKSHEVRTINCLAKASTEDTIKSFALSPRGVTTGVLIS